MTLSQGLSLLINTREKTIIKEEGNIDHANTLGFLRGFQHQTQIQVSRNYYGNLQSPLSE